MKKKRQLPKNFKENVAKIQPPMLGVRNISGKAISKAVPKVLEGVRKLKVRSINSPLSTYRFNQSKTTKRGITRFGKALIKKATQ